MLPQIGMYVFFLLQLVSLLNIGGTSHVAYIGRDETYGRSLFVLSLLNVAASAQSAFDSLRTQSQTEGFTLDGFPASPYEPSSAVWKGYVYFRGFGKWRMHACMFGCM